MQTQCSEDYQYIKLNTLFLVIIKILRLVSMEFIKRYIHVAKVIKPTLSREAANCIAEEYARLRCQDQANTDVARVDS